MLGVFLGKKTYSFYSNTFSVALSFFLVRKCSIEELHIESEARINAGALKPRTLI